MSINESRKSAKIVRVGFVEDILAILVIGKIVGNPSSFNQTNTIIDDLHSGEAPEQAHIDQEYRDYIESNDPLDPLNS